MTLDSQEQGIGEAMRSKLHSIAITVTWFLALVAVLTSARYFLHPPPLLLPNEMRALSRHHTWLLLHIAGGMVAIIVGLFQLVERRRNTRPRFHRAMGYLYLSAVLLAGWAGLVLSPDTPRFAADGLTDLTALDLSFVGLNPSFLGYSTLSKFSANQFFLVRVGFTALAIVWLWTAFLAFTRARERRFEQHFAWMIRNYSLTFAAVTVRLTAVPLLVLIRRPVAAITVTFWSWIVNLAAVEWIIHHQRTSTTPKTHPSLAAP